MELPVETLDALERFFEIAKRFYRRNGLIEADAEDCAADVRLCLLQLLRRGGSLSDAYFRRVLVGCLADFLEQAQRVVTIPLEEAKGYPCEPPSVQVLALREALGRLSPTDRELIWRCDGEGYSVKALAQEWGVREECLRQRFASCPPAVAAAAGVGMKG